MRTVPLAGEQFGPEEVTITHVNVYPGNFGPRTFLNFRTDDGERIHWRASDRISAHPNERVVVKGTVQEVDETHQVVLTRCKIYPLSTHSAGPAATYGVEPGISYKGVVGAGRAVRDSWVPAIIFIIFSLVTLIPLVGLLVAVFLVPILGILVVVLGIRLYRRRNGVDPQGSAVIRRNLLIAIGCLALSLIGGGYQLTIAITQILTGSG